MTVWFREGRVSTTLPRTHPFSASWSPWHRLTCWLSHKLETDTTGMIFGSPPWSGTVHRACRGGTVHLALYQRTAPLTYNIRNRSPLDKSHPCPCKTISSNSGEIVCRRTEKRIEWRQHSLCDSLQELTSCFRRLGSRPVKRCSTTRTVVRFKSCNQAECRVDHLSPEWVPICYEARSNAQGLPEPSFLRGSTLGTSPVEHQDSDWVWIE